MTRRRERTGAWGGDGYGKESNANEGRGEDTSEKNGHPGKNDVPSPFSNKALRSRRFVFTRAMKDFSFLSFLDN